METIISVPFYADLIRCVLHEGPFPEVARAQSLLLGSVAQESAFTYTTQLGGGPALGLGQVEPATELVFGPISSRTIPNIKTFVTSLRPRWAGYRGFTVRYDLRYFADAHFVLLA